MTLPSQVARQSWLDSGRILAIDELRAIADLLVCPAYSHKTAGFPDIGPVHKVAEFGAIGVDVFFVLSDFLITTLPCRERDRLGQVSIRDFYLPRAFRIIPAYLCFLLFVVALTAIG